MKDRDRKFVTKYACILIGDLIYRNY